MVERRAEAEAEEAEREIRGLVDMILYTVCRNAVRYMTWSVGCAKCSLAPYNVLHLHYTIVWYILQLNHT